MAHSTTRILSLSHVQDLPSPTLTNPDMILPDDADFWRASTPSPPLQAMRPPSPPTTTSGLTSSQPFVKLGRAPSGKRGTSARMTPPLDNYGTELSDIEEVETTPKSQRSREGPPRDQDQITQIRQPVSLPSLLQTPRQGYVVLNGDDISVHSLQKSIGTTEPIPVSAFDADDDDEDEDGQDGDGDRTPVGDHDGFQESAHSDDMEKAQSDLARIAYEQHQLQNGVIMEENEDQASSATLSTRAEKILANAKKRLDNMEGNLSRARHSMIISPSGSMSPSWINGSPIMKEPSPSQHSHDQRIHPALGIAPARHRQLRSSPPTAMNNQGHARISSESSVPSSLHTSHHASHPPEPETRSKSAFDEIGVAHSPIEPMGIVKAASVRLIRQRDYADRVQPQAWQVGSRNYLSTARSYKRYSLSPALTQVNSLDEAKQHHRDLNARSTHGLEHEDHDLEHHNPSGLSRSQSTLQMRDVRVQMKDLKGRISTLQQRAKEDHMRRRSMQSLRTPSPFTAAEQWYLGVNGRQDETSGTRPDMVPVTPRFEIARSMKGHIVDVGRTTPREESSEEQDRYEEQSRYKEQSRYEEHSRYEDADEDQEVLEEGVDEVEKESLKSPLPAEDDSWQGDYLEDYDGQDDPELAEDTVEEEVTSREVESPPIGERHEDRADAFDYQHFYLHSGMGNYSKNSLEWRKSSGSYESVESVRTALVVEAPKPELPREQGPRRRSDTVVRAPEQTKSLHHRQASTDSLSTVATFATATEGHENSDEDEDSLVAEDLPTPTIHSSPPNPFEASGPTRHDDPPGARSDGSHTPTAPSDAPTPTTATATSTTASSPTVPPSLQPIPTDSAITASPASPRAASLTLSGAAPPAFQLGADDRVLVEAVLQSLGRVCLHLNADKKASDTGQMTLWRRRLHEVRRVLDEEEPPEGDDGEERDEYSL